MKAVKPEQRVRKRCPSADEYHLGIGGLQKGVDLRCDAASSPHGKAEHGEARSTKLKYNGGCAARHHTIPKHFNLSRKGQKVEVQ